MSAMMLLSSADRRLRNGAVLGLLVLVIIAATILWAAWWRPWQAAHERANQLAERQARSQELLSQGVQIRAALAQAEATSRQQPLWLPLADPAQAANAIAEQIDQAVAVVGGNGQRCKVQSRNPATDAATASERLSKATLNIRIRCGNAEWLQLAHILESSQPPLVLDTVSINAPPQYPGAMAGPEAGVLDIAFTVSGFLAPRPTVAAEASP